jgi:hypothetical protein
LFLLLLGAGEAWSQAEGPCIQCHLGRARQEQGLALGSASFGALDWQVEPCPALAQLRRRQAGLEERLFLLAARLPELAKEHYPLSRPQAGLVQAQGLLRLALTRPVTSTEEALGLFDQVDQAVQEQVEIPLRAHEQRLARMELWGWLALGLLLTGLAWLWGWRRLLAGQALAAGASLQPPEDHP